MITCEDVLKVINRHRMIKDGDRVITGVSGGADSMCLLFLMSELREEIRFFPEVIHVHHGIRGKSADEDLLYVEEQCRKLHIPFKPVKADIPAIAKERGLSEEEAGRIVRYEAFNESGADRIAVAHHMEDSAETILFNLFRGTGLQGLGGIRPVSGKVIRPLIFFTRQDIEEYCREKGINYRSDETNDDTFYARNRIRQNILPEAEKINPAALKHIVDAAEKLSEISDHLNRTAEELFLSCTEIAEGSGKLTLDIKMLSNGDPVLQGMVLKKCIGCAAGRDKDISTVHVRETENLLNGSSGKQISLPYGVVVKKSFDRLIFSTGAEEAAGKSAEIPFIISENGEETAITLPDGNRVTACITEKPENIPELTYTKWLDYDKIKGAAVWRTRRQGDRISIRGGSKKLKDLFIEEKTSADKRDSVFLLADDVEVIWVPGSRIGHKYKVTESTKRVLKVSYDTEKEGTWQTR